MNLSIKRTYGKTLAIVLAVSMLLTGPVGVLEAHAEDGTPPAVESVDSGTQGVSGSTATPSDVPLGTSSVQDSGTPIQQRGAGGPTLMAATGMASATAGYPYISVDLSGTTFTNDATNKDNWSLDGSSGLSITSISKTDTNAFLQLDDYVEEGDTITVSAVAAALTDGSTLTDVSVTIHIPIAAIGTAVANAGEKTIAVALTAGTFGNVTDTDLWILGGTSAGGNPIDAVAYQNGSNVAITLTNPIGASDNYTLQAKQNAFGNIITKPFATPLDVTINSDGATVPAFAEGYPRAGAMQLAGSRQVGVVINAQEAAYYDFVLLPDGADAPSAEQVRDGKAADGQPALKAYSGKSKLTANSALGTSSFTPDHNTDYDLYVILRDDEGNLSTPVKVDVKSPPAADFLAASYPKVGDTQPNGSKQVQIQVQVQGTDQEGKVYWVLLPDHADAPTVDEVGAGTASGGGDPISSGSPEFAKDTLSTFLVTGAQDATAYVLYLVVGDAENFNPLAECTDVVMLDVTTPAAGEPAFQVVGGATHATLSGALGAVENNGTIKLLRTANTTENVTLLNKTITLELGTFDLNITSPADEGIKVTNGTLAVTGTGKLNATGKLYGVWANNGTVIVDDAASGDGIGVFAMGGANITVRGNATGQSNGVYASDIDTEVTVKKNVTSTTGQTQGAVYSLSQAEVTVEGNVSSSSGYGVHTSNSGVITVEGNVTASRGGAYTEDTGGSITIKRDLSSYNHCAIITSGSSGNITVDGTITPLESASYVLINNVKQEKGAGVPDPEKSSYLKYSGSGATGVVWVRQAAPNVCSIGAIGYPTLDKALEEAIDGNTITLLQSITHTNPVMVADESITFALGSFDLTINTSAIDGTTALLVTGGGVVSYTGAGKFSAIGNSTAVRADGAGSALTVGYAETTRGSAYTVQAMDGGTATIKGNVLAKGAGTRALDAITGGEITVQGNVTCEGENSTGALATGTGSTIHVTGDITATAAGTGSTGVYVKGDGEATIIGNISASEIGITTSGLGDAGTVTVTGNVSTTGTATGAADREGIGAGGGGSVIVNGNVSAAGENCTGVYTNGSAVIVTGSVTSENTGVVSTGDMTWRGRVFIDDELTAGTPYIRVGSTPKTAAEDTKPSDQAGYLKYTDGIHSVYVKDASGIIPVSNATELEAALGSVADGGTIRLTTDINYSKGIVVDGKTITLDVGSFTLNVSYSTGYESGVGLKVINSGHLNLAGSGAFNVTHTSSTGSSVGVYADTNCSLTVTNVKSVSGTGIGAYASGNGSVIRVLGNVEATGSQAYGAATHGTGEITIDGIMTATYYTKIYTTGLRKNEGVPDGDYLKYALAPQTPAQGIVRVKIAPAVCEIIGGAQYDNLPEAIAAAASGKTIKLLDDIVYEKSVNVDGAIQISGKTITFDLNGHNLTIRNPEGAGLQLKSSANVTVTGTGNLNIVSQFAALHLDASSFQSDGNINAILESSINSGIHASYQSTVNIQKGSIISVSAGIYTLGSNNSVTFGGPVTVNGKPDWNAHGVDLYGNCTGNTVHVSGKINIASGLGAGIHVENGGIVTVGSSEAPASVASTSGDGIWTSQGSTTSGITVYGNVTGKERAIHATGDADIKVFGDVKSTSALASVYAVEGLANSGDTIAIAITGNVEGPNGVKYHGNNGTISITGNVTATSSASDTVGVYASYGSVSVTGNVATPSGIGAEAGKNGEITIGGVLTGNTYVKVYYAPKTVDDKTLPTTKDGYHTYSHPAENATVWVKDGAPATTYALTVQNGTGGGSYLSGMPVSIMANPPAPSKVFDKWITSGGGSFGDANSASTTFTMPSSAVTITATYKDTPAATYLLTVVSGTGSGSYAESASVSITANPPAQGKVFDKWTTSNGGSFGNANSASTTFTMPANTTTITATYKDAPAGAFTLTVSGSYAQSTGTGQYAPDAQVSIHAGSRSNYSFNGWTSSGGGNFANANSASTTFTMPSGNVIVTANWRYNGGGGSGSSDDGGSSTTPPATSAPIWLEQSGTPALIANATDKGYTLSLANGQYGVRQAAWTSFTGYQYWHDTMDGNAVQVRVYVKNPTAITSDLLVSGYVKGSEAERVKTLFEKYFANKVRTIHLDQTGVWGQSVEVAAKVDLTGVDVTKLMIYSYDKATNTYHRIEKPTYWVDTNGYLHFTTALAGDIIISEGPLTLKNGGAK